MRDVGFSIVNNLNFVFQMGTGWMAFLSLVAYALKWPFLAIQETHAFSELGSFLLSGRGGVELIHCLAGY
jgi:hypothetical protein